MGKGGRRHFPKPSVDAGLCLAALKNNIDQVQDMGPYETLSRTSGCNPQGLIDNIGLLKSLVKLEPSGEIHPQPLKAALLRLLTAEPTLTNSKFNGTVWINLRQERITCLLTHLRKLARDPDGLQFCAVRLNGSDFSQLKAVLNMLELRDEPNPTQLATAAAGSDEEPKTVIYDDFQVPPPKRTLKKEVSAVSVDSDGFPNMAKSPEKMRHLRIVCEISWELRQAWKLGKAIKKIKS